MFRKFLNQSTFSLGRRFVLIGNNMSVGNSVNYKKLFDKIEGIERNIYSILTEIQDVKKYLSETQNPNRCTTSGTEIKTSSRSFSTLIPSPSKSLKRRKPIHDALDLDSIDFDDNDFGDTCTSAKKLRDDFHVDSNGYVQVYTDGACENNGKYNAKAGIGVWFGPDHPLNVSRPVSGRPTNNVGEIEACTCAIKIASDAGVTKLCINTDSQFVINSMTKWISGWKRRNWTLSDGGPVKNKEDFIALDEAQKLIFDLKWNYVKGHSGCTGNEAADHLAKLGAEQYRKK